MSTEPIERVTWEASRWTSPLRRLLGLPVRRGYRSTISASRIEKIQRELGAAADLNPRMEPFEE